MKKNSRVCFIFAAIFLLLICANGYALNDNAIGANVFGDVSNQAAAKDGVKEITYEQFMRIRNSGQKYVLLDARSKESYEKGHIEGALFLPSDLSNPESAKEMLSKDAKIVVYCASFECHASSAAAKKLMDQGYNVLDYKGGIKDWEEKGNKPVK